MENAAALNWESLPLSSRRRMAPPLIGAGAVIVAQQVRSDVHLEELIREREVTPSLGDSAFAILPLAAICCAGIVGGDAPGDLAWMTALP